VEKNRLRALNGLIVGVGVFLVLFAGHYPQYQLSPLAYKIMPMFKLTTSQFSAVFTAASIAPILLAIVSGTLADRFGVKIVVGIGVIIAAIGTCMRVFADNYGTLFFTMILSGCGFAVMFSNFSKFIGTWFKRENIGKIIGICMLGTTLSMTVASATTAYFPSMKSAYITAAVVSVFTVLFWFLFVQNKPADAPAAPPAQPIIKYLGVVFKSKAVWVTGICVMGVFGSDMTLSAFLPVALKTVRGINPGLAGIMTAMFFISNLCGVVLGPVLFQKIGRTRLFMIVMGLLTAFGMAFAWLAPQGVPMGAALFVTGFSMGSLIPVLLSFPMLIPEIGPVYAGSAGGLIVTLEQLGSFFIPTYIIAPIAGSNYHIIMYLAGVCMIFMCLVAFFLPELLTKSKLNFQAEKVTSQRG